MTRPAILVVEDEPLIRMEAVDMFEDEGFRVYDAANADAALALMARHGDIGVLFTDVDMPGSMNGLDLAEYVATHWPAVRVIIASGVIGIDKARLPEDCAVYPKPYPTNRILADLAQIGSARGAEARA